MTRWSHAIGSLVLAALAVPAIAGDVLFVSDTTTDSANVPATLAGGTAEIPHPTIPGAALRPAAGAGFYDVTIVRWDYVVTGGGPFPLPAEGTNPTLAGLTTGVTLADYLAIFWSASGPHEPDVFGSGLGTDGGLHTDPDVFSSLTDYIGDGGYVYVTGHDAAADPLDQLLVDFLAGGVSVATSTQFEPPSPGTVHVDATVLTSGDTDITGASLVALAGVAGVGPPDQDALSSLGAGALGLLEELTDPSKYLWTIRAANGSPVPLKQAVGHVAYVAAGIPLLEDLPWDTPPSAPFVHDGEDPAWAVDPVLAATLLNFAKNACAVPLCTDPPVITLNGAASMTLECGVDTYVEPGASVFVACDPDLTTATVGGDTVDDGTPGTYVVTYNATDVHGNAAAEVTRTVTVVDTTPPVITLNGAASLTLECGIDAYSEPGATVFDACDTTVTVVVGGDTVDDGTPGTYVVTYDATDASGNVATQQTRTVTVQDTRAPVITLNGAASLTLECGIDTYAEPGARVFDACDATVVVVVGGDTVDDDTPGTYVVTYDATDASGNVAVQRTRTVTVQDTIRPLITLNGAASMTLECGVDTYSEPGATVFDACDSAVAVVIGGDTVDDDTPGTYVVTYDATDASGNVATQRTRTVTVQDTTAPVITLNGANPLYVECSIDTYTDPGASVSDACDTTVTAVVSGDTVDASTLGTYVVRYDATDASGNVATQVTRTVIVRDTTAPSIDCPDDIVVETANPSGMVVTYSTPTATDACDSSPTVSCSPASGSLFAIGVTTVTCTATDASGNVGQCTFTVTVEELSAEDQTEDLIEEVEDLDLPANLENPLVTKLESALDSLEDGNENAAKGKIRAFINQVNAKRGKGLTDAEADALIAAAEQILDRIDDE